MMDMALMGISNFGGASGESAIEKDFIVSLMKRDFQFLARMPVDRPMEYFFRLPLHNIRSISPFSATPQTLISLVERN